MRYVRDEDIFERLSQPSGSGVACMALSFGDTYILIIYDLGNVSDQIYVWLKIGDSASAEYVAGCIMQLGPVWRIE